jgi:hypothetical protein
MGLKYWWSLDFLSPLNLTLQHNLYVLVIIKHFSKWLELVPLPNRSNEGIAYGFLNEIFIKFGVPTNKVQNAMGNSNSYVTRHQEIIEQLHKTILREMG